ncbi:MAG: hypothetical protein IH874_01480 [Candidatus Dadabacteria bacterium]|nr:hypothetical protein [Candidatus Dadabacteria bacterium]
MRKTLVIAFVLFLTAGLALAVGHKTGPGTEGGFHNPRFHKSMHGKGGPKHSMILQGILNRAKLLDLTDKQNEQLTKIKEKYVFSMIRKEADQKIEKIKMKDMFHDPKFDSAKLKAQIKKANQVKLNIAYTAVDTLSAIRSAVGPDNFEKLTTKKWHKPPHMKMKPEMGTLREQ